MDSFLDTLESSAERPGKPIGILQDSKPVSVSKLPDDDFDWRSDDSVICQEQPATAVYTNRAGGVVIRQERGWDVEEDPYVYFGSREAALALLAALQRLLHGGR